MLLLFDVVQLFVRLVAAQDRVHDVVQALRAVMRPAQQSRGCSFAQISHAVGDERRINYLEEWDDAGELRDQFGSKRFVQLLELLETADERPLVEFRIITERHGLEYITEQTGTPEQIH